MCALILSILATALKTPQKNARELYRTTQLFVAAQIITHKGYFFDGKEATRAEILRVYKERITPMLTDTSGNIYSFKQVGIDEEAYMNEHEKFGFANLKYKLFYLIKDKGKVSGYGIPVSGYGLWDAIYGFIVIAPNGDTIIGTTWYDQKETPGLGGNIATAQFQQEFIGKKIFKPLPSGETDFQTAPLGVRVLKGTVEDIIGDAPARENAVDGIPGASITCNGVTEAYRASLSPYRNFLLQVRKNEIP